MHVFDVYFYRWPVEYPLFGSVLFSTSFAKDYVFVKTVRVSCLEAVFEVMQGEYYSPYGEARELIASLGLSHTSMSVGDIIYSYSDATFYEVAPIGFTALTYVQEEK
jgi:hypothetical protein